MIFLFFLDNPKYDLNSIVIYQFEEEWTIFGNVALNYTLPYIKKVDCLGHFEL